MADRPSAYTLLSIGRVSEKVAKKLINDSSSKRAGILTGEPEIMSEVNEDLNKSEGLLKNAKAIAKTIGGFYGKNEN